MQNLVIFLAACGEKQKQKTAGKRGKTLDYKMKEPFVEVNPL